MIINLTKSDEKNLRTALLDATSGSEGLVAAVHAIELVLGKIDAKRAVVDKLHGMSAKQFLDLIRPHWAIILPEHGGAERTYSRLTKTLRDLQVTPEQATRLAVWLKGQRWIRDNTLESVILRLPGWLTNALGAQNAVKTAQPQTKWEDE